MRRELKWWFCFIGVAGMPFVLAVLSYWIGIAVPGTINRAGWEISAEIAFVSTIIPVAVLLDRSKLSWLWCAILGCLVIPLLLLSAYAMQIPGNCGPAPKYIGQTEPAWNDSECGD